MSRLKKSGILLLIVLTGIQFIQPARNKSGQALATDITNTFSLPEKVQTIFNSACYDCHSNNTRYPWYTNIQPVGWLLAKHVKDGKADLNFSEFGSYSPRRQMNKLRSIENSIRDGTMPLSSYTLIHDDARLSKNDKALIIDWVTKVKDNLAAKK